VVELLPLRRPTDDAVERVIDLCDRGASVAERVAAARRRLERI
jgi:hypothetical protein